jgi:hypothetical protein
MFGPTDLWRSVSGTNLHERAIITSISSSDAVTLSHAAVGSSELGELMIGRRRGRAEQAAYRAVTSEVAASTGCGHLDLYDEWGAITKGGGWEAAFEQGLMADALHPSQLGHDEIARRVEARLVASVR